MLNAKSFYNGSQALKHWILWTIVQHRVLYLYLLNPLSFKGCWMVDLVKLYLRRHVWPSEKHVPSKSLFFIFYHLSRAVQRWLQFTGCMKRIHHWDVISLTEALLAERLRLFLRLHFHSCSASHSSIDSRDSGGGRRFVSWTLRIFSRI